MGGSKNRISTPSPTQGLFSCAEINKTMGTKTHQITVHFSESPSVLTTAPTKMPRLTNMEVTTRIVDISITISGNKKGPAQIRSRKPKMKESRRGQIVYHLNHTDRMSPCFVQNTHTIGPVPPFHFGSSYLRMDDDWRRLFA